MTIVAGLDVATTTGVCLGKPGQAPAFWSEDLGKRLPHEERFAKALKLTQRLINEHGVTAIGIEAPIIVAGRDKKVNNHLLMGLISCIQGWASIKGVPCALYEVGTIDKHFLGMRMKGREQRKAAIMNRCQSLGWGPQSDDEADAGAVFDITSAHLCRAHAIHTAPLFAGRMQA